MSALANADYSLMLACVAFGIALVAVILVAHVDHWERKRRAYVRKWHPNATETRSERR